MEQTQNIISEEKKIKVDTERLKNYFQEGIKFIEEDNSIQLSGLICAIIAEIDTFYLRPRKLADDYRERNIFDNEYKEKVYEDPYEKYYKGLDRHGYLVHCAYTAVLHYATTYKRGICMDEVMERPMITKVNATREEMEYIFEKCINSFFQSIYSENCKIAYYCLGSGAQVDYDAEFTRMKTL